MPSFVAAIRNQVKRLRKLIKDHPYLTGLLMALAMALAAFLLRQKSTGAKLSSIRFSDFLHALNNNLVEEVVLTSSSTLLFKTLIGSFFTDTSLMTKEQLFNLISSKSIPFNSSIIRPKIGGEMMDLLMGAGCFLASIGLTMLILNRKRAQEQHKFNTDKEGDISFSNIYGLQKEKLILKQTIQYLSNPGKFQQIGCRLRRGIIFYGPPGTGKTMLAKAMAKESNAMFVSCSAAEFCEMYVGVGPKRIRQLFEKAKAHRSVIVFIDEIDAIGKRKDERESDAERNNTLNQLLVEMDGFASTSQVVVIAATNRIEMIDPALLRSGRFDLKIEISLPSQEEREGILGLHLQKKRAVIPEELVKQIATKTQGFSGADLQNITNQAAYKALRKNKSQISQYQLEDALAEFSTVVRRRAS